MAEKEYEAKIAEAKAALQSYSAEQEAITRLYEQARQQAQERYEARSKQLNQQLASDRNRAAVDMMRTEKNLNQALASRGLAFSGENAQTKLDLSLALRGQLADLDRETGTQQAELAEKHADTQTDLAFEHAKSRAQGAKTVAELQGNLAALMQQSAGQNSTGQTGGTGDGATGQASNTMLEKADKTVIGDREFQQNFVQRLRQSLLEQERKKAQAITVSPTVSAQQLAKQLVTAVSSTGRIYGYTQQSRVAELLEELNRDTPLEDGYYREVLLNLRSLGYRPDYAGELQEETQAMRSRAEALYDAYRTRYRNLYQQLGYSEEDGDRRASREARFEQLAYVYANSESKAKFEELVQLMGLQRELDGFYAEVEKRNEEQAGRYTIGSALRG